MSLQGLEQDSRLAQQGRAIVLECTEDPFPWRSALGQHSSLLKVIRYVQTCPAAFDAISSCPDLRLECSAYQCVYCIAFCILLRASAFCVRCRKGFLPEEGLEDICSLLLHGFSRLVIVCGSATCDYLLSCVEEWKYSEQRWRRPKRQHMTPRSSPQQELPLALARRVSRPCRTQSCNASRVSDLCSCTDCLSLLSHLCCNAFMSTFPVSGYAALSDRTLLVGLATPKV